MRKFVYQLGETKAHPLIVKEITERSRFKVFAPNTTIFTRGARVENVLIIYDGEATIALSNNAHQKLTSVKFGFGSVLCGDSTLRVDYHPGLNVQLNNDFCDYSLVVTSTTELKVLSFSIFEWVNIMHNLCRFYEENYGAS